MAQRGFLVDDRGDLGRKAVQHIGLRIGLIQLQRQAVTSMSPSARHFRRQAELRQDEGGGQVQLDRALQRPGRILGADRVAGLELDALADGEGDGLAVLADLPALGETGLDAGLHVHRVEIDKLVIKVVDDVLARISKLLRRIHADDVVDLRRDGQRARQAFGRKRRAPAPPLDTADAKSRARSGKQLLLMMSFFPVDCPVFRAGIATS